MPCGFSRNTMTAAVCAAIPAEQRSKSLQLVTAAASKNAQHARTGMSNKDYRANSFFFRVVRQFGKFLVVNDSPCDKFPTTFVAEILFVSG